ncbi:hypothetical protein EVC45_09020 [Paraburkholderia sp. UYCP14C]|uniref:hypothetical protein n=1 Tax=Paraburkholderia sp. UYCP14C TaxID=2511130 RepID=UPI001020FA00|nr:hypothetical protein [Paraburkholderia sp. UYCP14C]RZF30143.1 hypothetical protein EVC45_09020 [Paraburkholderia sp. UYCP14C]
MATTPNKDENPIRPDQSDVVQTDLPDAISVRSAPIRARRASCVKTRFPATTRPRSGKPVGARSIKAAAGSNSTDGTPSRSNRWKKSATLRPQWVAAGRFSAA